jgi:hypothetical protein
MEQHLQLPRAIVDRINWWHVGTTIVIGAFVLGGVWAKVDYNFTDVKKEVDGVKASIALLDERAKSQASQADDNFKDLKDIPYRVQLTEKALDDIRRQFTLTTDRIGDKIDKVLDNQAKTDTKVEVVGSQIEDIKKSIGNKIVWRDSPLFPIPLLREVSLKPCYLPDRPGYTRVKAYYRVQATPNPAFSLANR